MPSRTGTLAAMRLFVVVVQFSPTRGGDGGVGWAGLGWAGLGWVRVEEVADIQMCVCACTINRPWLGATESASRRR
jgi:hypothetical protein